MRYFFTADTHWGHERIITLDARPFATVGEMDAELVRRWNAKVGENDRVYVLGDMIWGRVREAEALRLLESLHGEIILIRGNHDHLFMGEDSFGPITEIREYDEITVKLEDGSERLCVLSHYYMPFYNAHYHGAVHLHGHSHNSEEARMEREYTAYLNEHGFPAQIYNVGCMHWNYEPVMLDEILTRNEEESIHRRI